MCKQKSFCQKKALIVNGLQAQILFLMSNNYGTHIFKQQRIHD